MLAAATVAIKLARRIPAAPPASPNWSCLEPSTTRCFACSHVKAWKDSGKYITCSTQRVCVCVCVTSTTAVRGHGRLVALNQAAASRGVLQSGAGGERYYLELPESHELVRSRTTALRAMREGQGRSGLSLSRCPP